MLQSLHVKNMALLREAEINFGPGLNILTGETGAGKSMVIGSVNAALGAGNFKDYQLDENGSSLVELIFATQDESILERLSQKDIPTDDGQIILTRKYQNGRTVNRINGESVTIGFIREIAALLIDVHGQHQHQSLLHTESHRNLLDRFGAASLDECKARFTEQFREWKDWKKQYDEADMDASMRAKQIDLLRYENNEIEAAELRSGEDEELEQKFRRMANGQKIIQNLGEVSEMMSGDNASVDMISRAVRSLGAAVIYDDQLQALFDQLSQLEDLAGGFVRDLDDYMDEFSYDEEEFQNISNRLDLINRLKIKYGRTIEQILEAGEERKRKLEQLENHEAYLRQISVNLEKSYAALEKTAQLMTQLRQKYALTLEKKILQALQDLNFPDIRFQIDFRKSEQMTPHGQDEICFMISMNTGMPLRPLQDVASGGELSRIMLAIKAVMADQDEIGTLIFDEIDTGISGRTAQKVSEKMAVIAGSHQVICITHLAQIAAMADTHFLIEKGVANGETRTCVRELTAEQQEEELARMLGGVSITEAVRKNAREMKALAAEMKTDLSK